MYLEMYPLFMPHLLLSQGLLFSSHQPVQSLMIVDRVSFIRINGEPILFYHWRIPSEPLPIQVHQQRFPTDRSQT